MFEIKRGIEKYPAKVLLYGTGGIGKTTLAAGLEKNLILDLEGGANTTDCARVTSVKKESELWEFVKWFAKQDEFKTLTIDTWTRIEKMLTDNILEDRKWPNLEAAGYGKGYEILKSSVQKYLSALDFLTSSGKNIVTVAHVRIKSFSDPTLEAYDRFEPDISKASLPLFISQMDAVFFYRWRTFVRESGNRNIGKGTGERELYTVERPAYIAKNRYNMEPVYQSPTPEVFTNVLI